MYCSADSAHLFKIRFITFAQASSCTKVHIHSAADERYDLGFRKNIVNLSNIHTLLEENYFWDGCAEFTLLKVHLQYIKHEQGLGIQTMGTTGHTHTHARIHTQIRLVSLICPEATAYSSALLQSCGKQWNGVHLIWLVHSWFDFSALLRLLQGVRFKVEVAALSVWTHNHLTQTLVVH